MGNKINSLKENVHVTLHLYINVFLSFFEYSLPMFIENL